MLYILGAIKSEMHCAPGVAQTATCELQISLYKPPVKYIAYLFVHGILLS